VRTGAVMPKISDVLILAAANGAGDPHRSAGAAPDLPAASIGELEGALAGELHVPGSAGYDLARRGHNLAIEHHPAVVVEAVGPADVMAAVTYAARHGLPVAVLSTGHGAPLAADGAVLITTRRMQGVRVDPFAAMARIEAGVLWSRVVHEAAPFGLAPLSGSAPEIGAVGYTLGGGLGLLGRAFGYSADHVRSIDLVTANGTIRTANAQQYADLFWALRGGKGNFGVVTSMEIELFRVSRLFGGGLYLPGSSARSALHVYRRWVRDVPDAMTSSFALTRFPWDAEIAPPLRGRFAVHIRLAFNGSSAEGERLLAPLRRVALPLLDTVGDMPYAAAGSIHDDPPAPLAVSERAVRLRDLDEDAVDALIEATGPDSTCPLRLVELRHLSGALGREPDVPNAVGGRDAAFQLYLAGVPGGGMPVEPVAQEILDLMQPWTAGAASLNFLGTADTTTERTRAAFSPADFRRLVTVKRNYDPDNIFRFNHNIPTVLPTD
jgi:FAD/FMN-containing dehydrogenase